MGCISEQSRDGLNQIQVPLGEQGKDKVNTLYNIPTGHSSSFVDIDRKSVVNKFNSLSLTKSQKATDSIIKYPRLILEIQNTETNAKVDYIIITPNSIGNSEAKLIHKPKQIFSFGTNKDNDYVINYNTISQSQFAIKYNEKDNTFYVIENQLSRGVFLKIKAKLEIKEKTVLCFGNCFITLNLYDKNDKMNIVYHEGNELIENELDAVDNREFKIGRGKECDIIINSNSISRVQCTLAYEKNKWIIYDGLINRLSTNGLWYAYLY